MTLKLKPEIKKEWVAALRSGKYKQGQGQLHSSRQDTYCCLGVLCDIVAKKENSTIEAFKWRNKVPLDLPNVRLKELVSAKPLTESEKEYSAGGWEVTGVPVPFGTAFANTATLARLNDAGFTFNRIAEIIEEEF